MRELKKFARWFEKPDGETMWICDVNPTDIGIDLVTVKKLIGHRSLDGAARDTKPRKRDLEEL